MGDARPEMTLAEFDAAAAFAHEGHWLTGEEAFLHVPVVMQVEGWNLYGHLGQNRLTEPQRVLMMWSDIVGQTANGGFTQFVDNYESALALAHPYVAKLGWPDLFERFDRAFREQAGDPARPLLRQQEWSQGEPWPTRRDRIVAHLARKHTRWRPWDRRREEDGFRQFSDVMLTASYNRAVNAGEIAPGEDPVPLTDPIPTEAADAFDDWFYLGETRAASRTFIGRYVRAHRDDLCRLID